MRCLYCGKELALLKRWTRSGQFCSEAHKKSYQEEYNRIGLNRLLQAQHKGAPAKAAEDSPKAPNGPPPVHESQVAVEEAPAFEEVAAIEEAAGNVAEPAREQETPQDVWEPPELASFVNEHTVEPATLESAPYSESWTSTVTPPGPPDWRTETQARQVLTPASAVRLKFRPDLSDSEPTAPEVKMTPNEFTPARAAAPPVGVISARNSLPSAGPIPQQVLPCSSRWSADETSVKLLPFSLHRPSELSLLDLPCSIIAFSAGDATVEFVDGGMTAEPVVAAQEQEAPPAESTEKNVPEPVIESLSAPETEPEAGPQAISQQPEIELSAPPEAPPAELAGLANLHQELTQPEEPALSEAAPMPDNTSPAADAAEPVAEEHAAPAAAEPQHQPRNADLVDLPLKPIAPAKPSPKEIAGAQIELPVFLPRATGLPLRPKMGVVQGSQATSKKAGQRATGQPVQAADAKAESKPAGDSKPAPTGGAQVEQSPKAWGKPAQPAPGRTPAQNAPASKSQKQSPKEASATKETGAVQETAPKEAGPSKPAAKPAKNAETQAPATAGQGATKPAQDTAAPDEQKKPATAKKAAESSEPAPASFEVPTFGSGQASGTSFFSSAKAKIATAAVVVVFGVGAYFMFGGKSQAPVPGRATQPVDAAGPSIMVGGGGWVEGWAGDPTGAHFGRQITIYRPSLKLSDYRIEFKGEIETKSLGWVFRAADPENYYALKLAIVKPGAQPKIALLKYLVAHGHETQVGRVPIDINVNLDTLYSVRVDVRGPNFTTYVQGQQVDTWTDDQLKTGGMGFLNEREERGRIKTVSVSLLNGGKQ